MHVAMSSQLTTVTLHPLHTWFLALLSSAETMLKLADPRCSCCMTPSVHLGWSLQRQRSCGILTLEQAEALALSALMGLRLQMQL